MVAIWFIFLRGLILMFCSYYGSCDNQAAVPTNVSIATSSSGDYNNACVIEGNSGGVIESGDNFASGRVTINYPTSATDNNFSFYAYLRATGADTYTWSLDNLTSSWTNVSPPILDPAGGDGGTGQDKTYPLSGPLSCVVSIQSAPSAGDTWQVELSGRASNSAGAGVTKTLTIDFVYTL